MLWILIGSLVGVVFVTCAAWLFGRLLNRIVTGW